MNNPVRPLLDGRTIQLARCLLLALAGVTSLVLMMLYVAVRLIPAHIGVYVLLVAYFGSGTLLLWFYREPLKHERLSIKVRILLCPWAYAATAALLEYLYNRKTYGRYSSQRYDIMVFLGLAEVHRALLFDMSNIALPEVNDERP